MPDRSVDVFVEDRAHEAVVGALVRRVARDAGQSVRIAFRSARGGHPRALDELNLYQRSVLSGDPNLHVPDVLVVGIDANCSRHTAARREIEGRLQLQFRDFAAIACPDPHVERWLLLDGAAFKQVVGVDPRLPRRRKCERDEYKRLLARAVASAGHPAPLGGIEFAPEIVDEMDLYRAGRDDRSLKAFLDSLGAVLAR